MRKRYCDSSLGDKVKTLEEYTKEELVTAIRGCGKEARCWMRAMITEYNDVPEDVKIEKYKMIDISIMTLSCSLQSLTAIFEHMDFDPLNECIGLGIKRMEEVRPKLDVIRKQLWKDGQDS